jgi:nitrogenase molybdenum-iron protein NifN
MGAEPDLLLAGRVACWHEMGCDLAACVTTTHSPILEQLPCDEVLIGDLEDLEAHAAGCDLLITHSHGRQAAERLAIPLYRMGIPMFDRIGNSHRVTVGYRGTRNLVFEIANTFLANIHQQNPGDWPLPAESHAAIDRRVPQDDCSPTACGCGAQAA